MEKKYFEVTFNGEFEGYAYAYNEREAIIEVVGEQYGITEDGKHIVDGFEARAHE